MNGDESKITGVVVLRKKNLLGVNNVAASAVDRFNEILGRKVALQLITCSTPLDPDSASGMFCSMIMELNCRI